MYSDVLEETLVAIGKATNLRGQVGGQVAA